MTTYPKNLKKLTIWKYSNDIPLTITHLSINSHESHNYDFSKFNDLVYLDIHLTGNCKILAYPPNITHLTIDGYSKDIEFPITLVYLKIKGDINFNNILPPNLKDLVLYHHSSDAIKLPDTLKNLSTSRSDCEILWNNMYDRLETLEIFGIKCIDVSNFLHLKTLKFQICGFELKFPESLRKLTIGYGYKFPIPDFIEELVFM